jgi:hypothetical protein
MLHVVSGLPGLVAATTSLTVLLLGAISGKMALLLADEAQALLQYSLFLFIAVTAWPSEVASAVPETASVLEPATSWWTTVEASRWHIVPVTITWRHVPWWHVPWRHVSGWHVSWWHVSGWHISGWIVSVASKVTILPHAGRWAIAIAVESGHRTIIDLISQVTTSIVSTTVEIS